MIVFSDPKKLTDHICSEPPQTSDQNKIIIGIDGKDGSGKTFLATELAKALSCAFISLDDYLKKNMDGYVPFLEIEKIKKDISEKKPGIIIVEGVCLLEVSEKCGFNIGILIYIKRMDAHGVWVDSDECDEGSDPEEKISKLGEEIKQFHQIASLINDKNKNSRSDKEDNGRTEFPKLTKEIIKYHHKYKPITKAHYEFHRTERNSDS